MRFIVDRIEEGFAVCESDDENNTMISIKINEIPFLLSEGDVIYFKDNKWVKDDFEKNSIASRIEKKMNDLWE